ncbi:MAG: sulfite exporter TauE/SafE family protein [Candidatus Bipolaricaulota bacterium]|nr:MAG: sulfite exporter TauE/SafE family protein [Candidatus Bipolaricaulota bacterium]
MGFEVGTFFLLFFAAVAIGLVASLLGLGGGVFMTPLLLLGGFVATQQEAAGTGIAAVLFTGISASIAYYRRRVIDFRVGLLFMPSALAGVFLGGYVASIARSAWLTTAFGVFLLYPMLMMLFGRTPKELRPIARGEATGIRLYALIAVLGLVAGTATKLFGIGGGTVFVPSLVVFLGLDIVTAVATSLFVMIPTALASTVTSRLAGTLHLELAIPLILGIVVGAQIGPRVGSRIPRRRLRQLFSIVLLYAAVNMIVKGLQ